MLEFIKTHKTGIIAVTLTAVATIAIILTGSIIIHNRKSSPPNDMNRQEQRKLNQLSRKEKSKDRAQQRADKKATSDRWKNNFNEKNQKRKK